MLQDHHYQSTNIEQNVMMFDPELSHGPALGSAFDHI
jgi:hypothetical protein